AADLRERLNLLRPMHHRAKNVVFFLGDGMGISTITAARMLKGRLGGHLGEEGYLEFDSFPYSALIKVVSWLIVAISKGFSVSARSNTSRLGTRSAFSMGKTF